MALIARDLTEKFHRKGLGDEYGPELVIGVFNEQTEEFHGGFAGDNSSLCVQDGGARVWNGGIREVTNEAWLKKQPCGALASLHEYLARPMTLKHHWCYPRNEKVPFTRPGGGKAMWFVGSYRNREELIRDWTIAMSEFTFLLDRKKRTLLGDAFIGGADSGTNEKDLELICKVSGNRRCVTGGPGYIQYETIGATGLILLHAAKTAIEYLRELDPLRNHPWGDDLSISISGFGQVGRGVVQHLLDPEYHGPRIAVVSNKSTPEGEAIRNPCGIDPRLLLEAGSNSGGGILSLVDGKRTKRIDLGLELYELANILILAATKEPVIDEKNARRVWAPIVLSGTNSGITEEAYRILHERGIIAPLDSTVNIGAASMAWASHNGLSDGECVALAKRAVEINLRWLLTESRLRGIRVDELARQETDSRLEPLSRYRNHS